MTLDDSTMNSAVLCSSHMRVPRTIAALVIVAVAILGPTLFMASSPCLDCDGACGAAATQMPINVRVVRFVVPLPSDALTQLPPTPVLLSELPPRPPLATV